MQLDIDYEDGTRHSIITDESWKSSDSPIITNNVYLGEVYDARLEQPGWDQAGFDDAGWEHAVQATESIGKLCAQYAPSIKVLKTIQPIKITEPKPDVYIYDMGQNFAGRIKLKVKGPAGTKVKMRYGELLHPDGTLNVMTSVACQIKREGMGGPGAPPVAYQSDSYILKGEGSEVYIPKFTFHGFRYVEITGLLEQPTLEMLEGQLLGSAVESAGTFSCSNEMFNRIQEMTCWTMLSNIFSIQSDCPHREKFGYGGDILSTSEMGIFNFDMSCFYAKTAQDFVDAIRPNGGFTETAPYVGIADKGLGGNSGPIGWGTAQPWLLYQLYQYYGNRRIIEKQYEYSKQWVQLIQDDAKDHVIDVGISDHESLVPKPVALTGTAFNYYNAYLMSELAGILGRNDEAEYYNNLAQDIKNTFNNKFLDQETGTYDTGTQACQSFALYMDLVPEKYIEKTLDVLTENILKKHNGHLTTGMFGTKFMLDVLSSYGHSDVAYSIVNQKSFPGWGYMIDHNATTMWEHWAFSDNTYSHNHPMFGQVSEWFFKALAGIKLDTKAVGFNKLVIDPQAVKDLQWVKGGYNSIRGKIVSEWSVNDNEFNLNISIPANTLAEVYIPAVKETDVYESGQPASQSEYIHFIGMENNKAVFTVESGDYKFVSKKTK